MSELIRSMIFDTHAGVEKYYYEERARESDEAYHFNFLTNPHGEDDETNKVEEACQIFLLKKLGR